MPQSRLILLDGLYDDQLEIAQKQSDGYRRNQLVEFYIEHRVGRLIFSEVELMIAGLYDDGEGSYFSRHNGAPTKVRIAEACIASDRFPLSPENMARLALKQWDGYQRNRLIERYFTAHLRSLVWDEVRMLIQALYGDGQGSYFSRNNGAPVRDRMILAWTDRNLQFTSTITNY